jgi:hypothetical protein
VKRFIVKSWPVIPALAIGLMATHVSAEPSNKWRIEFDEHAQTAGMLVLSVQPVGGTAVRVETQIPAGTHENEVARLVRDSLKAKLGAGFNVEIDDAEDVLIKKEGGAADFDVKLVSSSATGLDVELERE